MITLTSAITVGSTRNVYLDMSGYDAHFLGKIRKASYLNCPKYPQSSGPMDWPDAKDKYSSTRLGASRSHFVRYFDDYWHSSTDTYTCGAAGLTYIIHFNRRFEQGWDQATDFGMGIALTLDASSAAELSAYSAWPITHVCFCGGTRADLGYMLCGSLDPAAYSGKIISNIYAHHNFNSRVFGYAFPTNGNGLLIAQSASTNGADAGGVAIIYQGNTNDAWQGKALLIQSGKYLAFPQSSPVSPAPAVCGLIGGISYPYRSIADQVGLRLSYWSWRDFLNFNGTGGVVPDINTLIANRDTYVDFMGATSVTPDGSLKYAFFAVSYLIDDFAGGFYEYTGSFAAHDSIVPSCLPINVIDELEGTCCPATWVVWSP